MKELPHRYAATVAGGESGDLEITTAHATPLFSAPPTEFDGPGDRWSPETLLVGALGDCLILTFRGVARASKLAWTSLCCRVIGTMDRHDGVLQFTSFEVDARLEVPDGTDLARARHVLEKAEQHCLISKSLKAPVRLQAEISATTRARACARLGA